MRRGGLRPVQHRCHAVVDCSSSQASALTLAQSQQSSSILHLLPASFQVAAVQFHLINTTILFLAREGFRRACLRINQSTPHAARRTLRIAALTIPAGALLSAVVTAVLLRSVGGDDPAYRTALVMQGEQGGAKRLPGGRAVAHACLCLAPSASKACGVSN